MGGAEVSMRFHQGSAFLQLLAIPSTDQLNHLFTTTFKTTKDGLYKLLQYKLLSLGRSETVKFATSTLVVVWRVVIRWGLKWLLRC